VGAQASVWSAGINPPRWYCIDGARGAFNLVRGTRLLYAPDALGRRRSQVGRSAASRALHVATRGRPNALTAEGWLTVKASSPAAAGHGVRPSATRHAPGVSRRWEGIALPACTEPRQTGSPAVTVQRVCGWHTLGGSMYSRADATYALWSSTKLGI
jgi:hypothetical protein